MLGGGYDKKQPLRHQLNLGFVVASNGKTEDGRKFTGVNVRWKCSGVKVKVDKNVNNKVRYYVKMYYQSLLDIT